MCRLSTPFWEFLILYNMFFTCREIIVALSTPFWEFPGVYALARGGNLGEAPSFYSLLGVSKVSE